MWRGNQQGIENGGRSSRHIIPLELSRAQGEQDHLEFKRVWFARNVDPNAEYGIGEIYKEAKGT